MDYEQRSDRTLEMPNRIALVFLLLSNKQVTYYYNYSVGVARVLKAVYLSKMIITEYPYRVTGRILLLLQKFLFVYVLS